jgi:hypothetical protein
MKIKNKSAKIARLVPRGATMLKCDRCDVSYPSCPSGRFDDGVHLTAVSNPAAGLTQAFGPEGGVPDGNLCASCMNSYIYWWCGPANVKGRRARELADYENGQTHPDIDEIEEQIYYPPPEAG